MSNSIFTNVYLANKKNPIELSFDSIDHYIQFQGIVLGKFAYSVVDARYGEKWIYIDPREVIAITPIGLSGELSRIEITLTNGQEVVLITQGNDFSIQTYQILVDKMTYKAALPVSAGLTAILHLPRKSVLSYHKSDLYISSVIMEQILP